MSTVTWGSLWATARMHKILGWVIEVWEDGQSGPILVEPFERRPLRIDKMAVIQALIQRRRDADNAKDEWKEWNRRADEESERSYRTIDRPPERPPK